MEPPAQPVHKAPQAQQALPAPKALLVQQVLPALKVQPEQTD